MDHFTQGAAIDSESAPLDFATLDTILAHCAQDPTIFLPSHDPESAARLATATIVQVDARHAPVRQPAM